MRDHEAKDVQPHHAPEEEHVDSVEHIVIPQHDDAVYGVLLTATWSGSLVNASVIVNLHEAVRLGQWTGEKLNLVTVGMIDREPSDEIGAFLTQ